MQPLKFKLFGFGFEVHAGFLLFLGVILLFALDAREPIAGGLLRCGVVALAFVVHELGHAFAARRFGLRVMPIELHFMVGATPHQRTTSGKQLLISLAGPAAGLLLGALALGFLLIPLPQAAYAAAETVLWVNVLLSLFNLLPIVPLDGGQSLRSGLELIWGHTVAAKATSALGVVVGLALMFFAFSSGLYFMAAMGGYFVYYNFLRLRELGMI